jgi:predicted RNase H-like HicB family nuclease
MRLLPLDLCEQDRMPGVINAPLVITPEIESLASRPYRLIVWHDEENGWAAVIPDLPGLSAAGDTLEEMVAIAEEAKRLWIAAALVGGQPIPEPSDAIAFSR